MDWARVLDEVAFSGPTGLTQADLIAKLKPVFPGYNFDEITSALVWQRISRQPEIQLLDKDGRLCGENHVKVRVTEDAWDRLILEGKAVKLTAKNRPLLQLIAASGSTGILQNELGKVSKTDLRNLHYHLLSLHQHNVIMKIPVSNKKAHTYLLLLSRWVDQQEDENFIYERREIPGDYDLMRKPTIGQMMRRISEMLCSAPDQSLSSAEIFALSGLPSERLIKRWVSFCLRRLVETGTVEMVLMSSLGGPRHPIYKFKSLYDGNEPIHAKRAGEEGVEVAVENQQQPDHEGDEESTMDGPELRPFISIEKQARDLIAASGPVGLTLNDIKSSLGISTKASFRVFTRLTERKCLFNSDVVRVTEFSGKERRHRLFVEREHGQENQEKELPSQEQPPATQQSQRQDQAKSTLRSESVTKDHRKRILLDLIKEGNPPILEVTRTLGVELGQRLAKLSYSRLSSDPVVDIKTLRRTADQLVEDGLVRKIVVAGTKVGNRPDRTLMVPIDLRDDDERLITRIKEIKEGPKIYDLTNRDRNHQESEDIVFNDRMEPVKKSYEYFGYIYGVMLRLRLLHEYISAKVQPGEIFETPSLLFEELPFGTFLRLVGISSVSPELEACIHDPNQQGVKLSSLPKQIHSELMRKRGVPMRRSLRVLLAHLTSLGLLVPIDDQFSRRHNLQIPLHFRLSPVLHLVVPPDGRSTRVFSLSEASEYWASLQEAWRGDQSDLDGDDPKKQVFQLVRLETSWMPVKPKQANRKQTYEDKLREVAAQLGLSPEELQQQQPHLFLPRKRPISAFRSIASKPTIGTKESLAKRQQRTKQRIKPMPISDWSQEESEAVQLIFVLLQDPVFLEGHNQAIWSLANGLVPGRDNIAMRIYTQRILLSDWSWMSRLLDLAKRVALIRRIQHVYPADLDGTADTEENGGPLKKAFQEYYHRVKAHLAQFDINQPFLKAGTEGPLERIWNLNGESVSRRLLDSWNQTRHYRTPLIAQFEAAPYFIQPDELWPSSPLDRILPDLLDSINAIKVVMTWPAASYTATFGASLLSAFPETSLKAALNSLISWGYLAKSSFGRNRYRVPGTPLALSHRVANILLSENAAAGAPEGRHVEGSLDAGMASSLDLGQLVDGLLSSQMTVRIGTESDGKSTTLSISLTGLLQDPILTIEKSRVVQILSDLSLWLAPRRSWFWPASIGTALAPAEPFHWELLRGALHALRQSIDSEPGITLGHLQEACWPLLTPVEVNDCVAVLAELGICKTSSDGHVFPLLSTINLQ